MQTVFWCDLGVINEAEEDKTCPPGASISQQVMFVGHCFHNTTVRNVQCFINSLSSGSSSSPRQIALPN